MKYPFVSRLKSHQISRLWPFSCHSLQSYFFVFALIVLGNLSVVGATLVVTKTADTNDGICNSDCSLREAISVANQAIDSDTIEFDPTVFGVAQSITLNGVQLETADSSTLTINGPGANLLTINGNLLSRVILVNAGGHVSISNLKILNGRVFGNEDGAGLRSQVAANLVLNNVSFENNVTTGNGGAIYNVTGPLTISGCTFLNNSAGVEGGAIDSDTFVTQVPVINIDNTTFSGNTANVNGGAVSGTKHLTLSNSSFSNNQATGAIGALVAGPTTTITNVNFINNRALGGHAGAIYADRNISIAGSTFTGNSSSAKGGAIYFTEIPSALNSSIQTSVFTSNSATLDGGAINSFRSTIVIQASRFDLNSAGRDGGAVFQESVSNVWTIDGTEFSNNNASRNGGGLFNGGAVTLNNSLFAGNRSLATNGEGGGAIYNQSATLNMTNSTLYANSTSGQGGGIVNRGGVNLTNVTIASNQASVAAGVFNFSNSSLVVRNTIIGDNISSNGSPDYLGILSSPRHSLVENASGLTVTGTPVGLITGKDPQLIPLRNNGGTLRTVSPHQSSPVIDSGDQSSFPSFDQRGVPRPQDGNNDGLSIVDMGAYESEEPLEIVVTKVADTNDGQCDSDCSFREAITFANSSASREKVILFEPGIFSNPQVIVLTGGEIVFSNSGSLLVSGPGANLLSISGNNSGRVLMVGQGTALALSGLNVTNGTGSGTFFSGSGGGIFVREGFLVVKQCRVSNNVTSTVSGFGGGIYNFRGRLIVQASEILNNTSQQGGGVYNSSNGSLLRIETSEVSANVGGSGAGIYNWSDASIDSSSITSNRPSEFGGGGGIYNVDAALEITNSNVSNNIGGGIFNNAFSSKLLLISTHVSRNTIGGGVRNLGNLSLRESTILGNTSSTTGGGIDSDGPTTIAGSSIVQNSCIFHGGGIRTTSNLTLSNSTVSGNSSMGASFGGGGIFVELDGSETISVVNSTIAFNHALSGGGVFNNSGVFNIKNSIISDNSATVSGSDFEGIMNSQGYNLLENIGGTTISGSTTGNILGVDPKLDPILRINGGSTTNHALRSNSPAIDTGSLASPALVTDQRGFIRPYNFASVPNAPGGNGSDIGAFERQNLDVSGFGTSFDFDGDLKTDIGIYRPNGGSGSEWWVQRSSNGSNFAVQFGAPTDKVAAADYTGDGKTDVGFWRPSTGFWYVLRSEDLTFYGFPFGANGDTPVPADYDADGKADAAVFRESATTWYIQRSGDGGTTIQQFGAAGDVPVNADYDGDGKADIAIYRPSLGQWWLMRSSAGTVAYQFGNSTDKTVVGDYTGDGKADVAFWRPSTGEWFVLRSEDNSFFGFPFGISTDTPVPGDYDGDGRNDAGVFRSSNNTWYIQRTTAGTLIQQFGATGDLPLPNAYVR